MPSGGARARSGPPPDPNALRRNRKDDAGWETLPAGGYDGDVPELPLDPCLPAESRLWVDLWRKPQAAMWAKFDLKYEVAAYVRAYVESTQPEAVAGLKTAVLRMATELGLSLPGMAALRWKFSSDEVGERREDRSEGAAVERQSARDRLKALNG